MSTDDNAAKIRITHREVAAPLDTIDIECADEPTDSLLITRRDNMWYFRVSEKDRLSTIAIRDDTMSVMIRAIGEELAGQD